MIKTPLSTVIGGAFWAPEATIIGGQQSFSQLVKKLFVNSEQGFFYDPNDLSTMFQDSGGTVPVTDVGQAVGLIRDKSGRNNHAFQTNSASRPILRKNAVTGANYLEFDGTDDSLQTNTIDFTGTDKISLFAGVVKFVNLVSILCELSANTNTELGSFYIAAPEDSGGIYSFKSRGQTEINPVPVTSSGTPAYDVSVLSAFGNISGGNNTLRRNAVSKTAKTDLGLGNLGNHPLYIGRRAGTSFPFNGHIYSLIGVGKLVSDSETTAIEKELAKRAGVTLSV